MDTQPRVELVFDLIVGNVTMLGLTGAKAARLMACLTPGTFTVSCRKLKACEAPVAP